MEAKEQGNGLLDEAIKQNALIIYMLEAAIYVGLQARDGYGEPYAEVIGFKEMERLSRHERRLR